MEVAEVYLDILEKRIKEILKKFTSSKGEEEEFEEDEDELVIQDSAGDIIDIIPPKKRRVETVVKKLIIVVTIVLSNTAYILLGGYLFSSTETTYQNKARANVKLFQEQYCQRFRPLYRYRGKAFKEILTQSVHNYTSGIYKFLSTQNWDGEQDGEPIEQWQFDAAVLYSIVVVTTIGYGDVTPKSRNGRLLTVIYAMLGIPIFLMFINVFGHKLGKGFKYMYYHITCRPKKEKKLDAQIARESENLDETPVELTTDEKKSQKTRKLRELLVPLHVSVCVLMSYLLIGALFFTIFEAEWNFLISFYFCFISLTTVGFGDFVFGKCTAGRNSASCSSWKVVTSCFYILIGLGVVSMSFNHMAQTFTNQFRDLGFKLGILKSRESEEARKRKQMGEKNYTEQLLDQDDEKLLFKF